LRHEARLRHFLGRVAGTADGDELAQDAFLRAWQHARDWRGEGSYAAWLAGIGWRLFLDRQRRHRRRQLLAAATSDDADGMVEPAYDAALDAERLLAAVSASERAAMILCLGHGWSHAEAAAILSMPLGTVKSLVLRGREKALAAAKRTETA
jgi:RNA polymerase sigma-70 factor (ECF subfamily)